jgi:hypothetical protein
MFYAEAQAPHALHVDQNFHVFPPQPYTFLAHARFEDAEQGALPPLHEPQL